MITVKQTSKNIIVEATFEFTVVCEACEIEIDVGEIEDKYKLITDISVNFFCNLRCLTAWAVKELEESEQKQ